MTFGINSTVAGGGDYRWLGSQHATSDASPVTLDRTKLTANTHYPKGFIPSGFAVGPVSGSDKWEPFNSGSHTKIRFVLEPVPVDPAGDVVAAAIWHGEINNAHLPFPLGAAGITVAEGDQFTINGEAVGS